MRKPEPEFSSCRLLLHRPRDAAEQVGLCVYGALSAYLDFDETNPRPAIAFERLFDFLHDITSAKQDLN